MSVRENPLTISKHWSKLRMPSTITIFLMNRYECTDLVTTKWFISGHGYLMNHLLRNTTPALPYPARPGMVLVNDSNSQSIFIWIFFWLWIPNVGSHYTTLHHRSRPSYTTIPAFVEAATSAQITLDGLFLVLRREPDVLQKLLCDNK